MQASIRVALVGVPEEVQRVADILDREAPGLIAWHDTANTDHSGLVEVQGIGSTSSWAVASFGTSEAPVLK